MTGPAIRVTGRGAVSCFGAGHRILTDAVLAGRSGIRPLERLAGIETPTAVAAEVPGLTSRTGDLTFRFALAAAREALQAADIPGTGCGLVLATTKADMAGIIPASGTGLGLPHRLATRLAAALQLTGPRIAVSCACASGLSALAMAGRWLRTGRIEEVLVVGTDSLNEFILRGFSALFALSPGPCRPFDRQRDGLSLGEGAGAIVLSMRRRAAAGSVCLAGWGESNDAHHVTGPSRDGAGLALAIARAARAAGAGTTPDWVHLHGTGTVYNDAMEARALRAALGPSPPPAAGSKGQIGHTLGAAGLLESLVTIAALEAATLPGNHGLREPDAECSLDLPRGPRPFPGATTALKLAAGFGGINAALLWQRDPA